jgi:hypothetical protein
MTDSIQRAECLVEMQDRVSCRDAGPYRGKNDDAF